VTVTVTVITAFRCVTQDYGCTEIAYLLCVMWQINLFVLLGQHK